jgi:ElaB/YqjD/DUF883 family membrane-anchored ribosome-binding protein
MIKIRRKYVCKKKAVYFNMWKNILILVLIAALALLWLFKPKPEPVDTKPYEIAIAIADLKIDSLSKGLARLHQKRTADSLLSIKSNQEYQSKVLVLRSTVAKLKANPTVIRIREENPEVDSLIVAQDSVIHVKDERITFLESEIRRTVDNMNSFNETYEGILKAEREKFEAQQRLTAEYKQQNRKLRRNNTWTKIGAIAAGVGMFVLGVNIN